jgi:hypothetical protein
MITIKNKVEKFPQKGGWFYIALNRELPKSWLKQRYWGLFPVVAKVGDSIWKTSIMPKGDGTLFLALNQKVMKAEGIVVGDKIIATVELRS